MSSFDCVIENGEGRIGRPIKFDQIRADKVCTLTSPQTRLRLSPTDLKDFEQAKPMLLQIVLADNSSNRSSQTVPFISVFCSLLLVNFHPYQLSFTFRLH